VVLLAKKFIVQKEYEAPEAVGRHKIPEHCPACGEIGMCHYDVQGCGSHWRECTNPDCDFVKKLSPLSLTCSCGKKPEQNDAEKLPRKTVGCPFNNKVLGPP
jgi:hypothetical protein